MGLGQYDDLGEYCFPHTASSVFLILVVTTSVIGLLPRMREMQEYSNKIGNNAH